MNHILDYISSVMSGGILLLTLLGFYGHVGETAAQQAVNNGVQGDFTSSTEVLEYDLRKIGFGAKSDPIKITRADSSRIVFRADMDLNNTVDSVSYFLGDVQTPGSTNPLSRILYRARFPTGGEEAVRSRSRRSLSTSHLTSRLAPSHLYGRPEDNRG